MAKILFVKKETVGRYAQGTNFTKGDYIPTETHFYAKLVTGGIVELTKQMIWHLSGRTDGKRVSQKDLELCKGKDFPYNREAFLE